MNPIADSPPLDPVNLLLVDDVASSLTALEAVLTPLGHRVVRADSGQEALRQILKTEFAVIILDVQMPLMDGFETADIIRDHAQSQNVPIIFITGSAVGGGDRLKGYAAGGVDYLLKPIIPEILRAKVQVFARLRQLLVERQKHIEDLKTINQALMTVMDERQRTEEARVKLADEVKMLSGLLPICAGCKKIRDTLGQWSQIETYISRHSAAQFSHGFCPDCLKKYYPEVDENSK